MKKFTYLIAFFLTVAYSSIQAQNCQAEFQYWTSGLTVQFMDSTFSTTGTHSYSWSFGDGGSSTLSNPGHTYNQGGTYAVRLMIQDSLCFDSIVKLVTVTNPNPPACTASFTVVKDSASQFAVTLYNTSSTASSHQYSWDFGDGNFGQGRYPTHQYNSFGSYVVCLKITDTLLNCITTYCDTVGMDSLGNLKSASGFSLTVRNPIVVGVDENEITEAISVYPNPAVNQVSLDLTTVDQVSTVRIVDITGSVVFQDNNVFGGAIREINVANFKNGLYFIQIQNGDNTQVKKLVKTN